MTRLLLSLALVLFTSLASLPLAAQVKVTTTIKPLQLIAAAITDGVSEPQLLIDGMRDHHHHALRPSERINLQQAQLLLWVGPEMEGYLATTIDQLPANVVTALSLPGITLHRIAGGIDPHLWLDTGNARVIAEALAENLIALDPDHAADYRRNLARFQQEIDNLAREIQQTLHTSIPKPYAVYHNGFQYFENEFGLGHVLSVVDSEEIQPGIREFLRIKRELEAGGVDCLLVEPGVNTAQLHNIFERDDLRYPLANLMGDHISPGPHGYSQLLRELAAAMVSCLH